MPPEDEVSRATVSRLAGLLRSSLATDQERLVPLARELSLVESYLEIEKLRYQSRLRWMIDASLEARAWMMPPLLVQGLVENAIKHGINRLEQGGEIQIFAKVDESRLHLHVTNPGLLDTKTPSVGLGLVNARARLNLLFGPGSSLELHAAAENRVCVRVCLPMPLSRFTTAPNS
jgi:LytS/YehU family sensor histidine kinase